MKKTYLIAIAVCLAQTLNAQITDSVQTDSAKVKAGKNSGVLIEAGPVKVSVGGNDSTKRDKKIVKYPNLTFGLTFEHFDIGLSKYHTGSDFGAPAAYEYLETDTWKTSNVGFDVLQLGLRFSPNIKVMLAAGLDWNHMRLKQNVTIAAEKPTLQPEQPQDPVNYSKNRFSSRYIRVPLYFEYRSPQNKKGNRTSIVFGPEVGFLIDGKVKQISKENGKEKFRDDYNFAPFRYGANIRVGYGGAGLFFKYYLSDVFAKNQGPTDYKNLSFGLTFGF